MLTRALYLLVLHSVMSLVWCVMFLMILHTTTGALAKLYRHRYWVPTFKQDGHTMWCIVVPVVHFIGFRGPSGNKRDDQPAGGKRHNHRCHHRFTIPFPFLPFSWYWAFSQWWAIVADHQWTRRHRHHWCRLRRTSCNALHAWLMTRTHVTVGIYYYYYYYWGGETLQYYTSICIYLWGFHSNYENETLVCAAVGS